MKLTDYPKMPLGTCFQRSRMLAALDPDELMYVEGRVYFTAPGAPDRWFEHGWNETLDGQLVDSTWDGYPGADVRYVVECRYIAVPLSKPGDDGLDDVEVAAGVKLHWRRVAGGPAVSSLLANEPASRHGQQEAGS